MGPGIFEKGGVAWSGGSGDIRTQAPEVPGAPGLCTHSTFQKVPIYTRRGYSFFWGGG